MPKRSRSGVVRRPVRVVAPTRVNFARSMRDRARRRPLADDEVELEILHRRIEDFLDRRVEAMDLVDEQHVAVFEIGEQRREIARLGDDRAGGGLEVDAQLARHDLRQRRLAEAGRAGEQHMVQRLAARLGRLDEDAQVLLGLGLADEFLQPLRPQMRVDGIFRDLLAAGETGCSCQRQFLERQPDQFLRGLIIARLAQGGGDGRTGLRLAIAEIDQRRDGIRRGGGLRRVEVGRQLRQRGIGGGEGWASCPSVPARCARPASCPRHWRGRSSPCPAARWHCRSRAVERVERMASATLVPTPCTDCSRRNQSRSSAVAKPTRRIMSWLTSISVWISANSPWPGRADSVLRRAGDVIAHAVHVDHHPVGVRRRRSGPSALRSSASPVAMPCYCARREQVKNAPAVRASCLACRDDGHGRWRRPARRSSPRCAAAPAAAAVSPCA